MMWMSELLKVAGPMVTALPPPIVHLTMVLNPPLTWSPTGLAAEAAPGSSTASRNSETRVERRRSRVSIAGRYS